MRTETLDPFAVLEPLAEIVCTKCNHRNPGDALTCEICERRLLVFCGHCGHPNYRGTCRCVECRTQLHIPGRGRWKEARSRKWIKPVEVVLFVLAVSLTALGAFKLANLDLPKREPAPTPIYVLKPDGTWHLR